MFRKTILSLTAAAVVSLSLVNATNVSAQPDVVQNQKKKYSSFEQKGFKSISKAKINTERGLKGSYTYIIRLKQKAVVNYDGSVAGYPATRLIRKNYTATSAFSIGKKKAKRLKKERINFNSAEVLAYSNYLDSKQQQFYAKASAKLKSQPKKLASYKNAINGMALRLTQQQAIVLSQMDEVEFVERETIYQLNTDRGPTLIGAPQIWDGSATGLASLGEGVIIGVVDTGINTDHASFADVGGDGYDHTNPLGAGVYVGDCETAFPELCNDKLIGVRSYAAITDNYSDTAVFGATPPEANGEDYNGHGSHTASTAGGNVLNNVDLLDKEQVEESDGINSSGFQFPSISGVAPHANIIAYQVCDPGDDGDTYAGCPGSALLAGINDAVADGVDVINYSIGGGSPINPWSNSVEQAFLSAQAAGIFVATSAGNSGPGANTAFKPAPWYTAVAASTHGRTLARSFAFDGNEFSYANGTGPALAADVTAPVVYSGDVAASNIDGCDAFPASSFANSIALIQRGNCNFSDKVDNANTAGALAVVVFNNDGDNSIITMGGLESTTIPAVFISNADGVSVVNTLSGTPGTAGTIQASFTLVIGAFDSLASFSSRGPGNTLPDVMVPQVTAPGVSIYAAYSDQQFGHDVNGPASADFSFLQGTSMASPHVAGAAALLTAVQPNWTPDNIRSALMMTATSVMTKENGTTDADIFDMGSGRIRVDIAAQSGLVMDETQANYAAADPDSGGDPKTLNIPSMGNMECRISCVWTRTVTATQTATWNATTPTTTTGLALSVSPTNFTLNDGETQELTITADVQSLAAAMVGHGSLVLTPTNNNIPVASLPIFVKSFQSNLPLFTTLEAHRNTGSQVLKDIESLEVTDFTATTLGMDKADKASLFIRQDSDNTDVFDNLNDGVVVNFVNLANNSAILLAVVENSTAPDLDLFIGRDDNEDSLPSLDELLCTSLSADADEACAVIDAEAGDYWVLVQSYTASAVGANDSFDLQTVFVGAQTAANLTVSGPQTSPQFTPYDLRLSWNDSMTPGDLFVGQFSLGTDSGNPGNLGSTFVILSRDTDDVEVSVSNATPPMNASVTFTVSVGANNTDEDIDFGITSTFAAGLTVDMASLSASSGTLTPNATGYSWDVSTAANSGGDITLTYTATVDAAAGTDIAQTVTSTSSNINAAAATSTASLTVTAPNSAPVVSISAPSTVTVGADTLTLDASASTDADGDALTYSWTQTAGPVVTMTGANTSIATVAAGNLTAGSLTFQVAVSDGVETVTSSATVTVNAPAAPPPSSGGGGGGSPSWLLLALILLGYRRKLKS